MRPGLALILLAAFGGEAAGAGCVTVASPVIRMADLARSEGAFGGADPALEVAPAPAPGLIRVFREGELDSLAKTHGIVRDRKGESCFERATRALGKPEVEAAVRTTLSDPSLLVEILETSRYPVPDGVLEFPLSGVLRGTPARPDTPLLWRGRVVFDGSRSLPVWVRLRVSVQSRRTTARRALTAGTKLTAEDVVQEDKPVSPFEPRTATAEEAAGRKLRRNLQAGDAILARDLTAAKEVERGAMMRVEVRSGAASLHFASESESEAGIGGRIVVRNPLNGKRLLATVISSTEAIVDLPAGREAFRKTP